MVSFDQLLMRSAVFKYIDNFESSSLIFVMRENNSQCKKKSAMITYFVKLADPCYTRLLFMSCQKLSFANEKQHNLNTIILFCLTFCLLLCLTIVMSLALAPGLCLCKGHFPQRSKFSQDFLSCLSFWFFTLYTKGDNSC